MARKKHPEVSADDREIIGGLLRELRKGAGYRSVELVASIDDCPASRQTIYSYERGGLVPSLAQFLELVEFYVLHAPPTRSAKPETDLRALGVAAVARVLALSAYNLTRAWDLMARMQPETRKPESRKPESRKPQTRRKDVGKPP
jgi:hypothetical protein